MPRYYREVTHHHKLQFIRRFRKVLLGVCLLIILGVAGLVIDAILQQKLSQTPSEPTAASVSTFAPAVEVYKTQYFQFQSDKNWTFIASESNTNKYVFRKNNKNLVEHILEVYVDKPYSEYATRVMPVTALTDGRLVAGPVSAQCKEPAGSTKNAQRLVFEGVEFFCNPTIDEYTVVVGVKGQGVMIPLNRPDGSKAVYTIVYRNVKFNPDEREIVNIVESFQTR